MNRLILTCVVAVAVFAVCDAGTVEKRSLLDWASKMYEGAWETFLPDSTRETCRGLGWVDKEAHEKGLLDHFVPSGLAHLMGASHQGVFPESMEASFCTSAGMIKPGPPPATPQISGQFGMLGNQKVLVTPQGQVYDLAANYLGMTNQLGNINYMTY